MNRWLIVALLASVTINLLLLGFVAGRAWSGDPPLLRPGPGALWMLRTLPQERREQLAPLLEQHRHAMHGELRNLGRATEALASAIESPTLDEARLRAAAADARRSLDAVQQHTLDAIIEVALALPTAERTRLAAAMRDLGRRRPDMRGPRPGGGRFGPPDGYRHRPPPVLEPAGP